MKKEDIDWEIISKSFRGNLSSDERVKLEEWLGVSDRHREFYERAKHGDEVVLQVGLGQAVLDSKKNEMMWKAREVERARLRRKRSRVLWYAAAVVLPLAIVVGMWMNTSREATGPLVAERVQPGSGRVVLELNDGRTYFLDTTRVVETGVKGSLAKAERKSLVYEKRETEELIYNKVTVPRAGEYALTLSDGTRVWLNSETEIRYPVAFDGKQRVVFLTGEAYFEVVKDSTRPFHVVVNDMEVKVYGTSFNVNTHHRGSVRTALIEGKVGIRVKSTGEEFLLKPSQVAKFDVRDKRVEVSDVDIYYYTAWRLGEFVFQNETIEEIMDRLCLWYDTEVFYVGDNVKSKRFTGVITRFSDVADVLHLIGETATVRFDLKGNVITVSDSR